MPGGTKPMNYNWMKSFDVDWFNNKKLLIAGGTGFIGKRLITYLQTTTSEVYVLTRRQLEDVGNIHYIRADLNQSETLENLFREQKFDAAVYMAANIPILGSKKETYREAERSTLAPLINFLDNFCNKIERIIYISSVDVLGICDQIDYNENTQIGVATPYGLAKYCGEFYVKDYFEQYSKTYITFRFSQVYGPNEPIVRIIPILINAIKENSEFNFYTNATELRRFLYVDDAVQAIVKGIVSKQTGIYNIAGKEKISMLDLVVLIENIWNKKLNYHVLGRTEGHDNVPGIEKSMHDLNYIPEVPMSEGLKIVWEKSEK